MMLLNRAIETAINTYLQSADYKIFFIWGPRRSGKTTLLKKISTSRNIPIFNFDLVSEHEKFIPQKEILTKLAHECPIILIDEIQNYPQATLALKILHDEFAVKIIATGSSELRQKGADFDTLTGRFTENYCLPFSIFEIADNISIPSYQQTAFHQQLLTQLQTFGAYPEVYLNYQKPESVNINLLQNILDTYVLKDIINIYDLKNTQLAKDILTKIALQIGSEVSLREIANSLQANVTTVANYIEIFIKNYILIPLPSFKTNLRRAVSENRKLYFYDLGIRNILIKDFRDLNLRPDKGSLFENFIVSELEKKRKNLNLKYDFYFYREYSGQEVDLVLADYHKRYTSVEIKTTPHQKIKDVFPLPHTFKTIDSNTYIDQLNDLLPTATPHIPLDKTKKSA